MTNDETVTLNDVIQAWQEQLDACDLFENAFENNMADEVVDARREDMLAATKHAQAVQELYNRQYEERWELT